MFITAAGLLLFSHLRMLSSDSKSLLTQWAAWYDLPLYMQPDWLDIVCAGGEWGACLVDEQDIKAATVWYRTTKLGFNHISNPPLTAFLPLWIKYPDADNMKDNRKIAIEYRVIETLIRQFPAFSFFKQNYLFQFDNWLPFYWRGFRQTTKYTYIIEDLGDSEALFRRMEQSARTDIRKAQALVTVKKVETVEPLYTVYQDSFQRQGLSAPLDLSLLRKADQLLARKQQRCIYIAEDSAGVVHAGLYVAWDGHAARCLLSGTNTGVRSSGALYLLFWQAMQDGCGKWPYLDLEGSMHEPIERMLRSLGGVRKPYMCITKVQPSWLEAILMILGRYR